VNNLQSTTSNLQSKRVLVTGSVAYDNIMVFPGYFKDHILPEKVHMLSVSFLVESMRKQYGGVASNISYSLGLLGEHPELFATVGEDFEGYRNWLNNVGVKTDLTHVVSGDFTATCYITTDLSDNQITGFYPGAMSHTARISLKDDNVAAAAAGLVIIGPSSPDGILQTTKECQELGIPYFYAPTQQIVRMSGEELTDGLRRAYAVVSNDYEYEMIRNKTGLSPEDIAQSVPYVFVTLGAEGSFVLHEGKRINIPPAQPTQVEDPTGGGDAYIAGVTKGLINNYPIAVTGRLGSLAAVYAIEHHGTQAHSYTLAEFGRRYEENFGALPVSL
jgi:adenosine kinase